jgi:hypothetical protein
MPEVPPIDVAPVPVPVPVVVGVPVVAVVPVAAVVPVVVVAVVLAVVVVVLAVVEPFVNVPVVAPVRPGGIPFDPPIVPPQPKRKATNKSTNT